MASLFKKWATPILLVRKECITLATPFRKGNNPGMANSAECAILTSGSI